MGQLRHDKTAKQMFKEIQTSLGGTNSVGGQQLFAKGNKYRTKENWVPVWPQLDQGYDEDNCSANPSSILNSSTVPVLPDRKTYGDMDISSLRR